MSVPMEVPFKVPHRRYAWLGWVVALGILLPWLSWQPAPSLLGSSYRFSPDGYRAWVDWMAAQGSPVSAWRQPLSALKGEAPTTVIQVYGDRPLETLSPEARAWIEAGNHLLILGWQAPVSAAPFAHTLSSPFGSVHLDSRRRWHPQDPHQQDPYQPLLADQYGWIARQQTLGRGRLTQVATPYFAANAYQHQPGNFAALQAWAEQAGGPIWIDEYLHGFRDPDPLVGTRDHSVWFYVMTSPWILLGIQGVVLVGVAIWGHNRRFGSPLSPVSSPPPNTVLTLQAMARILKRGQHRQFVIQQGAEAERQWLQRHLGLGQTPVDPATLMAAWTQQTGHPPEDLQPVLRFLPLPHRPPSQRAPSLREYQQWLEGVEHIHRILEPAHLKSRGETNPVLRR